jgi:hypothetical protein
MRTGLVSSFFVFLVGCGGGSSGGTVPSSGVGSCAIAVNSTTTCIAYTGTGITSVNAENLCINTEINSTAGVYSSSSSTCSTAGEIEKCVTNASTSSEQTFHYLSGWTSSPAIPRAEVFYFANSGQSFSGVGAFFATKLF